MTTMEHAICIACRRRLDATEPRVRDADGRVTCAHCDAKRQARAGALTLTEGDKRFLRSIRVTPDT